MILDIEVESSGLKEDAGEASKPALSNVGSGYHLCEKFSSKPELWQEVEALTNSLRFNSFEPEAVFLREMFGYLSQEVQHKLLLMTADRSEDTMDHCRLLLLLLQRFPQSVSVHGPKLLETLMTAEKHSHYQNSVNCYRKLLGE
uniref:Integrator complex subunit 10 n=1 Tax=Timema shepardi TaxID=629360 RepID=A0A7R9AS17_TIMSH|nr:unnamed protein product [Timema shepardi]